MNWEDVVIGQNRLDVRWINLITEELEMTLCLILQQDRADVLEGLEVIDQAGMRLLRHLFNDRYLFDSRKTGWNQNGDLIPDNPDSYLFSKLS